MLRVTLEIVPFGIEGGKRPIGVLEIYRKQVFANPCDYGVRLDGKDIAEVTAHRYQDGAWELVRRATECVVLPETR